MSSSMRDDSGIWKQLLESQQQLREEDTLSDDDKPSLPTVPPAGSGKPWASPGPKSGLGIHNKKIQGVGGEEEEEETEHDLSSTGDDPHGDNEGEEQLNAAAPAESDEERERLAQDEEDFERDEASSTAGLDPFSSEDHSGEDEDEDEDYEGEEQLNAAAPASLNLAPAMAGHPLQVTGVTEEEPPDLPPVDNNPPTGEEPDRKSVPPVGSNAHKIDGDMHKEVEDRLKELMAAGIEREEAKDMAITQIGSRHRNNPNVSVGNYLARDSFEVRTTMKTVTEEFVRRNQNIRHYSVRQAIEAETARRLGLDQLDEFSTGSTHGGTVAAIAAGASTLLGSSNKKKLKEEDKESASDRHRQSRGTTNPDDAASHMAKDDSAGTRHRMSRATDTQLQLPLTGEKNPPPRPKLPTRDQQAGETQGRWQKRNAAVAKAKAAKESDTPLPGEAANYMAEDDGWSTSGPTSNTPVKHSDRPNPHPDEKDIDNDHSDFFMGGDDSKWWSYGPKS